MADEVAIPANAEWQLVCEDNWIFGEKIRGIVRVKFGEIYFDESHEDREGGWVWMAHKRMPGGGWNLVDRGRAACRSEAIYFVEKALGIAY